MKKKTISILPLLILLLNGCVDYFSDDIKYTIYNQTNKQVTVSGYAANLLPGGDGIAGLIVIAPQSSYTVVRTNGVTGSEHMSYYSLHDGGVDSVRVVFEDEKLLVYTQKNLSDDKTFTILYGKYIGEYHKAHYITEEDYALAVDCGEECF